VWSSLQIRTPIHEVDVIAEKQVQILVAAARQLLFDRLELKQQIVTEGANQGQPRILRMTKLLDQRA
jgi:sRNA-binding carbon storage regulator CsrA